MSPNDLFALAERYHAFSGSQLAAYTLPTAGVYTSGGAAVEVVEPESTSQMLTQFLGGPFGAITTPPLDSYGEPLPLTPPTTTTTLPSPTTAATTATSAAGATTTTPPSAIPSFDPQPC